MCLVHFQGSSSLVSNMMLKVVMRISAFGLPQQEKHQVLLHNKSPQYLDI